MSWVLVPVVAAGCGTETAVVRDVREKKRVKVRDVTLVIVGGVVHARGLAVAGDGPTRRVLFPHDVLAWCAAVPDAHAPDTAA